MSDHADGHGDQHYIKIWGWLLLLLAISFVGPELNTRLELDSRALVLLTAFGIAIVKAYMVAVHFMHINLTPRFVIYTVSTTLVFMLLFFAGAAPDVMKERGTNWIKPAWIEAEADYAAKKAAGIKVSGLPGHGDHADDHGEAADGAH